MLNMTYYALNFTVVYALSEQRLMHVFILSLSSLEHFRELSSVLLSLMLYGHAYGDVLHHLI